MRQYKNSTKEIREINKVICNKCGKEIKLAGGVPEEDMLEVEKRWGYFSGKDNRRDRFELCEKCYDELLESFLIPAESEEC